MSGQLGWAIAIPAHNEADRIGACLAALTAQRKVAPAHGAIVVFANNCTDDTARIARSFATACALHVVEHSFGDDQASAGAARRLAMDNARALVRDDGILLTTDADAIADDDWVATMLGCFDDRRVDLVAGRVSADWEEMKHHPQPALDVGALEWRYCNLLSRVEDALDPLPHDPQPRHAQQCGANIGIRAAMFDAVGGVPAVAVGEDRALIEAVFECDGGVRHANAPHVTASARVDGRADGGMATALRERIEGTYVCDELVLPAAVLQRRLALRHAARIAFGKGGFENWAALNGVEGCRAQAWFGSSWTTFMARNPTLAASPVRPVDLHGEIAKLERLLEYQFARHVA